MQTYPQSLPGCRLPSQQMEKSCCLELFPFLPMAGRLRLVQGMQWLPTTTFSVGGTLSFLCNGWELL